MTGGDCDNILPHTTFGMFATNKAAGAPLGSEVKNLGASTKEHGRVVTAPTLTSSFFPAFSLSGDYIVTGEFDLRGQHYSCTQKVEVRAPGLRAEGCWDTVSSGVDLDLHMVKVNGFTCGAGTKKGWAGTCTNAAGDDLGEDCYYANCTSESSSPPSWYSPATTNTCVGWGSKAQGNCFNPRLDVDTNGGGACAALQPDPGAVDGTSPLGTFCSPENINIDEPGEGDKFAVSLRYFAGSLSSKGHVNIYCNGARVLSAGYNPLSGSDFPHLKTAGGDSDGDMWKVALITTHLGGGDAGAEAGADADAGTGTGTGTAGGITCDVVPTASKVADAVRDGSSSLCVDNNPKDGVNSVTWLTSGGGTPATANNLCFH